MIDRYSLIRENVEIIPPNRVNAFANVLKSSPTISTNTDSIVLQFYPAKESICRYSNTTKIFEKMDEIDCIEFNNTIKCTQSLQTKNNQTFYIKCHKKSDDQRNANTKSFVLDLIKE